ncbi:hypothetical protein [Streptomyces crystallinus]|uniref:IrrE N-terminal-like domain-containing protein n=1 Tax=Streptomyces crystallinus TaxID=68191 RepID=A0ABN1GJA1_9ACTN
MPDNGSRPPAEDDDPRKRSAAPGATGRWAALREQWSIQKTTWAMTRLIRRDIGLRHVADLQGLLNAVAAKLGKPITVVTVDLPPGISGFSARGRDRYYIAVARTVSEFTRITTTLHELGHLWVNPSSCDGSDGPMTEDMVRQLLPGLNPGPVLKILRRSHFDDAHEREVEVFATLILQRLPLGDDQIRSGSLTSGLAHRRSGV